MKPFYRVLTYLLLIIQSCVILCLLADKRQPDCTYTADKGKKGSYTVPAKAKQPEWRLAALPAEIMFFRLYNCRK